MAESTVTKTTPILSSPADYHQWESAIKREASAFDIWKYVDPSILAAQHKELEKPVRLVLQKNAGSTEIA